MISRPKSRSCRTASIRSGIAGGLAGELDALDGNEQRIVRFRPRQEAENRRRLIHRLMIEQDLADPRLNRLVKLELEVGKKRN
jgi:hypothetical protein